MGLVREYDNDDNDNNSSNINNNNNGDGVSWVLLSIFDVLGVNNRFFGFECSFM